ncbi:MAG: carbohydrate kinase [Bacteroidales bacterium]|nr:carbohydrate kinase [Bacteroidales bacterium]
MFFLGFDIGSSSVKVSLINGESGTCCASAFYPKQEMPIIAKHIGWAEQEPEEWWKNLKTALKEVLNTSQVNTDDIAAIGISYQMHGLVCVDKNHNVLRPAIIWCDSRATKIGEKTFKELGAENCLSHLLNSPGNFTASKLKWIQENEPDLYAKIYKIMLPGDYIAMKLSGEIQTTISGLSEGMLWDFANREPAKLLMDHYGIDSTLLADIVPTFGVQCKISKNAAKELGLNENIIISYRAGDQPNNALSLNVLNPGEIATTAGTSGVVYGVTDEIKYDIKSRVNTFAHVNYTKECARLGILLCINGTGIMNSWLHRNICPSASYDEMNTMAETVSIGSDGLTILPFGNGAERVLQDKNINGSISGLSLTTHTASHLIRATHEGIAFSFHYGMEIMKQIGINPSVIRAGKANMFLSPIFRNTLSSISGATIELYNTDGSIGAARGAGIGMGFYKNYTEAFVNLKKQEIIEPDTKNAGIYSEAYNRWKQELEKKI